MCNYLNSRDEFLKFYKENFADRLLKDTSLDNTAEAKMLSKLKVPSIFIIFYCQVIAKPQRGGDLGVPLDKTLPLQTSQRGIAGRKSRLLKKKWFNPCHQQSPSL